VQDIDVSQMKAISAAEISLDLPDAIAESEMLVAHARCPGSLEPIRATIRNLANDQVTEAEFKDENERSGWQVLRVPDLTTAPYRIRVDAGADSEPIEDVFAVVG
jgi:hypothetical protein